MQLLGKEVSEGFPVCGILKSVGTSKNDPNVKFVNIITPFAPGDEHEISARLLPDVAYEMFVGHAVQCRFRLVSPQYKRTKYERKFYCDQISLQPTVF